jgi:hypothetical protein
MGYAGTPGRFAFHEGTTVFTTAVFTLLPNGSEQVGTAYYNFGEAPACVA